MNKACIFSTLILLLIPLFNSLSAQSQNPILQIEVTNIKEKTGSIRLAVYDDKESFLGEGLIIGKSVTVQQTGKMVIELEGLVHGHYAISMYHDKNDNEALDTNFLGIPNEPYGFSNNARGTFGPPKFEKAKFHFNPLLGKISIRLK